MKKLIHFILIIFVGNAFGDQLPTSFLIYDVHPGAYDAFKTRLGYTTRTDPADDQPLPLCGVDASCWKYSAFFRYENEYTWATFPTQELAVTKDMKTWGDVSKAWVEKYGANGVMEQKFINGAKPEALHCAIFGLQRKTSSGAPILEYTSPGQICLEPVTVNTCALSPGAVTLEHGNMAPVEIEGHIATGQIVVSCGSPLPVKFRTSPDGDLILKNGEISSHLTIDDKEIGTEMNLPLDRSDLTIKSTLKVNNKITGGAFGGSQTLIITVQ